MVEVLAGRLAWQPASEQRSGVLPGAEVVSALGLCSAAWAQEGELGQPAADASSYSVPQYPRAALGRAFGPFALDQVLRFCRSLEDRIIQFGKVCLTTPPGSQDDRANAAVLLGAYLVLRERWTTEEVVSAVGLADANLRFVCSFASPGLSEPSRTLRVSDCWAGLVLAREKGWIEAGCLSSDLHADRACMRHRLLADFCDAGWLIPAQIMVSADPVTVARDPNPNTFDSVFPSQVEHAISKHTDCSISEVSTDSHLSGVCSPPAFPSSSEEEDSAIMVNPETDSEDSERREPVRPFESRGPPDWITLLQENSIGMVIRLNAMQEKGMVEQSYDAKRLAEFGISHMDIVLPDGSVPSPKNVARSLEACASIMESGTQAILFHCKGGFGRSVVLACCLIIDQFDVPGTTLLGWVRIARPGAVNSPQQERFLQSLGGRADLRRYAEGGHRGCLAPREGQCAVQ
mmetsp:Transcript_15303/g.38176  ORF Transcript_15303/g.38176 Transcript_15303/m.38176 type:complete len:461 (-) Transcript_15303:343-1725(-)